MGRRVFKAFGSSFVVGNVGISVDFSSCVLTTLPAVPVVTVLFSSVNVVCEVNLLSRRPFLSLSRKREANVAWSVRQR